MAVDNSVSDFDLQAYHDGELDAAGRLRVESWLSAHPEDAQRLKGWRDIDQRLHQRFDSILADASTDGGIARAADQRRFSGRSGALSGLARAAVLAGLMIGSGLLGWSLHPPGEVAGVAPQLASGAIVAGQPDSGQAGELRVQTDLIRPALFAHQVYALDGQRPVEVPAIRQASLNRWVSERMHTPLRAPDLSGQGLSLMGGRLLPSSNRMAAQFMYQDARHKRTTVCVRRISGGGRSDFQYREQGDLNAFYWVDHAMGYAVIGEQPATALIAVAGAVQHAFAADAGHRGK